jgi:hypothetical protein
MVSLKSAANKKNDTKPGTMYRNLMILKLRNRFNILSNAAVQDYPTSKMYTETSEEILEYKDKKRKPHLSDETWN